MVVAARGAGDIGARAGTATRLFTIATFMSGTVTGVAATRAGYRPPGYVPPRYPSHRPPSYPGYGRPSYPSNRLLATTVPTNGGNRPPATTLPANGGRLRETARIEHQSQLPATTENTQRPQKTADLAKATNE